MSNNQSKRQKWLKIARSAIMALAFVTVLTYVSYSWIKREWTPNISQEGIKIVAGDSLTFIFEDENSSNVEIDSTGKTVNELLGMEDFTLKSVSNFTGESNDFFRLQYSTRGERYATFEHISRIEDMGNVDDDDVAYRELGKKNGYIEMKFTVKVPETADPTEQKGVFFHEDSVLRNGESTNVEALGFNPALALRVSVTVHDFFPEGTTARDKTVIFAADGRAGDYHTAVTNQLAQGDKYLADGGTMYIWENNAPTHQKNEDLIQTSKEQLLSFLARTPESGTPLFTLRGGESKEMTVRVWLEGEDENCVNAISGQEIDLMLKFCARKVTAATVDEFS